MASSRLQWLPKTLGRPQRPAGRTNYITILHLLVTGAPLGRHNLSENADVNVYRGQREGAEAAQAAHQAPQTAQPQRLTNIYIPTGCVRSAFQIRQLQQQQHQRKSLRCPAPEQVAFFLARLISTRLAAPETAGLFLSRRRRELI